MADLTPLLDLATRTATTAAHYLRTNVDRTDLQVSTKGTATDLVTDVDRAAEHLVVDLIMIERPDDGIVGEEGTQIASRSGVEWIIDPLDGTTNFVYGHPGFSVSIAAHVDGSPAVAAVADPMNGDLFTAALGAGARRNGVPIRCSPLDSLATALVATGFAYDPEVRRHQAQVLTAVIPSIRDIRRMGGAAIDLCSTACGRIDAYFERELQVWDLAAGAIIASEAGAKVGDLHGGPPSKEYCVSAPPALFGALCELLLSAEELPIHEKST